MGMIYIYRYWDDESYDKFNLIRYWNDEYFDEYDLKNEDEDETVDDQTFQESSILDNIRTIISPVSWPARGKSSL